MSDRNKNLPENIEVRGARVHNLKNVDVDIPLKDIGYTAQLACVDCAALRLRSATDIFVRLYRNDAGLLAQVKEFLCKMTE